MKKIIYSLLTIIGLIAVLSFTTSHICKLNSSNTELFSSINQVTVEENTIHGQAFFQGLSTDSLHTDIRVANYQLTPGSYFHWQTLPGGRKIIITEGEGYYQSKGKEPIILRRGDVIETIPGLYHWIGATPDSALEFISVTAQKADELVRWHEELTDAEYNEVVNSTK